MIKYNCYCFHEKFSLSFSEKQTAHTLWSMVNTTKTTKDPVAVEQNGKLYDMSVLLDPDHSVHFIMPEDGKALEVIRHTAAHLLAQAVKQLYPETQVTIGPVIEDGFFYDFYRATPFTPEDLIHIESRMHALMQQKQAVIRHVWSRSHAIDFFREAKEEFKVSIIESIPMEEELSVYQQGDFYDVCRGPHLPVVTDFAVKLTKVSGSYWKGNSQGEKLQRIYGTAWSSQEALDMYLHNQAEAVKRDHRKLGNEMKLFHFQSEAPGSVFWHPQGWILYQCIQNYIQKKVVSAGYKEVNTPQLVSDALWKASGHWEVFRENMFVLESEGQTYAMKPMNCPCHIQIFNRDTHSYKDLPFRFSEFGRCMRAEPSGSRAGLMRLVGFVQDDGHILCTPDHMIDETVDFCKLLLSVYADFGFHDVAVRLSTRPEKRLGDDNLWDHAESSLKKGAESANLSYTISEGEGAFYGPKLEFVLKDSLGRSWQCGTLQVDFVLPQRLHAVYVGADGQKHHPVMLHRAILGSFERFIGVLLEHTNGHLPLWIAPTQVALLTISEKSNDYASEVMEAMTQAGIRVACDTRNEKIGYKIHECHTKRIPYMAVLGAQEAEKRTITLRHQDEQTVLSLEEAVSFLQKKSNPSG